MTPLMQAVIDRWGLEPADWQPSVPCPHFFRGFTMRPWLEIPEILPTPNGDLETGFRYQDRWSNGFREVYVNEGERAIFTYCEGDLNLTVDDDEQTFRERLRSAEAFYAREKGVPA